MRSFLSTAIFNLSSLYVVLNRKIIVCFVLNITDYKYKYSKARQYLILHHFSNLKCLILILIFVYDISLIVILVFVSFDLTKELQGRKKKRLRFFKGINKL